MKVTALESKVLYFLEQAVSVPVSLKVFTHVLDPAEAAPQAKREFPSHPSSAAYFDRSFFTDIANKEAS